MIGGFLAERKKNISLWCIESKKRRLLLYRSEATTEVMGRESDRVRFARLSVVIKNALLRGNQIVVTFVQLRLRLVRSTLCGQDEKEVIPLRRETPNLNGHHPSDHPLTDC